MMWIATMLGESLNYVLEQGGMLVPVLGVVSLVGLAIMFEKALRLRSSRVFTKDAAVDLIAAIAKNDQTELDTLKDSVPKPMADIVSSAQMMSDLPREEMLSELETVASMHVRALTKRVKLLGILASIAPLLGMLGTVIGMIRAMSGVSQAAADPMVVGQGVSEALLTTAAGLIIGIPMLIVHGLIRDRINRFASEFEEFGHAVMKAYYYPNKLKSVSVPEGSPRDTQTDQETGEDESISSDRAQALTST